MGAAFLGNHTVKATMAALHVLINDDYTHATSRALLLMPVSPESEAFIFMPLQCVDSVCELMMGPKILCYA